MLDLLEIIPNRERSQSLSQIVNELEKLKRNVAGCESLIKQKVETEARLKETIETQKKFLAALKKNLESLP